MLVYGWFGWKHLAFFGVIWTSKKEKEITCKHALSPKVKKFMFETSECDWLKDYFTYNWISLKIIGYMNLNKSNNFYIKMEWLDKSPNYAVSVWIIPSIHLRSVFSTSWILNIALKSFEDDPLKPDFYNAYRKPHPDQICIHLAK